MMTMLCQVTWLDPSKRTMLFFVNMKYSHWRSWVYEHIISYPYWASSIIFLPRFFASTNTFFVLVELTGVVTQVLVLMMNKWPSQPRSPVFFTAPGNAQASLWWKFWGGDNLGFWKLVWRQKRSCGRVKHFIARGFSTFFALKSWDFLIKQLRIILLICNFFANKHMMSNNSSNQWFWSYPYSKKPILQVGQTPKLPNCPPPRPQAE